MNSARILQVVGGRFGALSETRPKVYRAERRHDDLTLGVYYFDLSQEASQPEFDIRTYTQQMLATDFYNHEGSLQWNYYLYVVLESDALPKLRESGMLSTIERDRTFARKLVRDESSIVKEFSNSLGQTLKSTPPVQDIASRWFEALTAGGLDQITDPSADYKPIIENYLAGRVGAPATSAAPKAASASDGQFIQSLDLGNFRAQPGQRRLDFGQVNLFRGANGVGKTSVLEAIELCICGGIRRQDGKPDADAELRIRFKGQPSVETCPTDSKATYRERDRAWYGGYYLQGNHLFDNFGRFNFFDTDAATKLSLAPTEEEIGKAIDTLFLGEFANTLEVRMQECRVRFERGQRDGTKFLKTRRADAQKATDDLTKIRTVKDTRKALIAELTNKAKECGWKQIGGKLTLSEITLLHQTATATAGSFTDAVQRITWLGRPSLSALRLEDQQLTETIAELRRLKKRDAQNTDLLEKDQARLAQLEAELKVVDRVLEYHNQPEAFDLIKSAEVLKDLRQAQTRLKDAAARLRGLDLNQIENASESLQTLVALNSSETATRHQNLASLQFRASKLQKQLGQIRSVVEEIKGLGIRYCEVNPAGKDCPLCGAAHDDLRARVETLVSGLGSDSQLSELTTQISREQANLVALRAKQDALSRIGDAAQLVFPISSEQPKTTRAITEYLARLPELHLKITSTLETREATDHRLSLAGFSATELVSLLDSVESNTSLPRSRLERSDLALDIRPEKLQATALVRDTVKERLDLRKTNEQEMRKLRTQHLENKSFDEPDVELERRLSTVEDVVEILRRPGIPIEVAETGEFATHAAQLSAFAGAVARIQDAYKQVEEKDTLEKSISKGLEETQKEIAKLELVDKRATTAIVLLDSLLGSNFKGEYLKKVRTSHREKIATVFLQIHSPDEFQDVHLNGQVLLERQTGVMAKVNTISTGQRAALALSIFLGLNSSVAGRAPWILLDDPIVHIDDLNVVSFLDMLRDLVLLGDRQIFFATANSRVGDLFARKFDFLGDNFKDFRFRR